MQFTDFNSLPCEGLELLLSKDSAAFSEFELLKLTAGWCLRQNVLLKDYLDFFDFDQMSDEQRAWAVAQIPPSEYVPSLVMNSMTRSNILSLEELHHFKLDVVGMRWKRVFDSTKDRMGRFMDVSSTALELFHRKLIVIRISTRLSIAIYIPRKIEKHKETIVDDAVRVFSFPHSQGDETTYRRALPTKADYRFYFDDGGFQLFEKQRSNTWIFFRKPGSDDAAYRNIESQRDRRRACDATLQGLNSDFVTSVALAKFSDGLARHIGKVNRDPVVEAEIYVISNRDIRSLQVLDQWLEYVDTAEIMPLFQNAEREYTVPSIKGMNWSRVSDHVRLIARDAQFSSFEALEDGHSVVEIFEWLLVHEQKARLRKAFEYLLKSLSAPESRLHASTAASMIDFLQRAPFLVDTFAGLEPWDQLPAPMMTIMNDRAVDLLKALALAANQMQSLVVKPFQSVLHQMSHMSLKVFCNLVEMIGLVVRSLETALDLLVACLELESSRLLVARPRVTQYFVKNSICIALDHIEERSESRSIRDDLLDLTQDHKTGLLKGRVRIDSHSPRLSTNDHIELTASTLPVKSLETSLYSMDALVEKAEPGIISIRCLHPCPSFLEDCTWRVKSCGSYVATKTMFEALNTYMLDPEQQSSIFKQMMAIGPIDGTNTSSHPEPMNEKNLNESQKSAVTAAIGNALTCLWGPPGTGKTHTIAIILEILSSDPKRRILVTAPSHNAVDNVMRKYLHNLKLEGGSTASALRVSTDVSMACIKTFVFSLYAH